MTPSEHEPDDRALDATLETIARADAPRDFTARVSAALDARNATPFTLGRVTLVMAAAAVLGIVGAIWIASRHATSPSPSVLSSQSTPTSPVHASPPPEVAPQSMTSQTAPAIAAVRGALGNLQRRHSRQDDHDRALPALEALPAVLQPDIAPPSLDTTSIEIDRMNAIAPLTVQGGRDTSGRGDF